ncbi:TRAF3-interacting protein 1-like isoform X2 [Gouania willdenowi]|uniref:TRAF3-interacting protein 1-like isoform X2 n=1 Tax=Gouania willdenowi TaxID=441366 RepID=UPI00105658F3|nr:TRAF3-interacting protein 1-like isoform X2 [Gouania willdenowi]
METRSSCLVIDGLRRREKYLDTLQSDSDSGESLFITQHNVSKAELKRKRRKSRRTASEPKDGNDSDTRSSIASTGKCLPGRKRKRKKVKLPMYRFPFLQKKTTSNGFTVQKNTKLHYAVMGGFLIGVRELQASFNRGEDLQASLPTIDEDGLCLSPLSEDEDGTMEKEAIRVVKNCFVVSSKKRASRSQAGGEKHQRSDKDRFQIQRWKDCSKTNQTEPSLENILDQNQTDTLCSNDDATVGEFNPREDPENNGSKSAAAADPELLPTEEAGGQILHSNGTNNDTACHESGTMEKKRNREEHKSREEEASNLTIKDQMSFTKDEMHTAELKRKKKKKIKNRREAEEVLQENGKSDMRAKEDLDILGKRKREITDSEETEQIQADTAFNPPNEDAQVSKKKKKKSKIIKLSLERMDETSKCLEDAAAPQETSEKPESVFNDDPTGEVTEAVTNNTHTSSHISMKKKKKKKSSPQFVGVLLNQDEEEEEPPQKPAEGADSAYLVTKKRKKKKKSSISICSEALAGTEDSECVTASSPHADAEEKALSGPRDPTSAEISTSLEEDNVLRKKKKKKKKIEAAERKDDEETHPCQSGDGIEVNRKKKGKRETLTLTEAPHSAADVDVLGKKKKRARELSALTDNDSVRVPESTLACSSQTSQTEQTSDTPGNVTGERKSKALKSDCVSSALTVTHRKNKQGKRRLHNPCEDFLSEG